MAESLLKASPWFIHPVNRPQALSRLFCFPRAGGGPSSFRNWPESCHPNVEAILLQTPGREARLREKPMQSMQSLVSAIADVLPPYLDRPFAFFGHSLGAKIAFETARELHHRNLPSPVYLYVAASGAPSVPWRHPWLHELSTENLLREVQRRYGGIPQEVAADPDLCALLVPALRSDLAIVETYCYMEDAPLTAPITCFCGTSDAMTLEFEALEWRVHTSANFRFESLSGDHFFPTTSRKAILDIIATDLNCSSVNSITR